MAHVRYIVILPLCSFTDRIVSLDRIQVPARRLRKKYLYDVYSDFFSAFYQLFLLFLGTSNQGSDFRRKLEASRMGKGVPSNSTSYA